MRRREPEHPEPAGLPSGPPCLRCGGERVGEHVHGGWLIRYTMRGESWYGVAEACPGCAFGYFRTMAGVPRYSQFPEATARDISILALYLRRGVQLGDAIDAVPFPDVRSRLRDLSAQVVGF